MLDFENSNDCVLKSELLSEVALTQRSAHSTQICSVRKKKTGFGLNMSQTTHEANYPGRHASIFVKGKRALFANSI